MRNFQNFKVSTLIFVLCLIFTFQGRLAAQTDWHIQGNTVTGNSRLGTNSAYDIIIETNNLERMRVKGAGNIGIGTDNPQTKLELVGDFRLGGNLKFPLLSDVNADAFRFTYIDNTGQLRAGSGDQFVASAYRSDCFLRDGTTVPAPAWNSLAGLDFGVLYTGETCPARVGIGTQFPLTALHVASSAYMTRLHLGNTNAISDDFRLSIWDTPGGMLSPRSIFDLKNDGAAKFSFWGETTGMPFGIWNGNTSEWFTRMNADGAVDFNYYGTDGVAFRLNALETQGDLLVSSALFDISNDGAAKFYFYGASTASPFSVWNGNASDWFANMHADGTMDFNYFGTGGIALSVFDKTLDQNIAALTSDGKWWCQGIVVRHVPFWGDFVFEPQYNLMPLNEVEHFIEENHHLPELPSASEIKKNGLEVEEMLRLLTIKIEELTLHAIEQEKEIEALKTQLNTPAAKGKK